MLLRPSNFLLLDEPTNHLDMRAKDVLLESLAAFSGTVVFVSHDRYFIDKLATRVFEIGGGEVHIFPGNYEDYIWRKQGGAEEIARAHPLRSKDGSEKDVAPENGKGAPKKKINPYKLREMQERRKKLEAAIAAAEAEIADCEQRLLTFQSAEETIRLTQLLEQRRKDVSQRMSEWEEVSQELETVQ
jgi:ATP-binding cassette subfamily F protein 3